MIKTTLRYRGYDNEKKIINYHIAKNDGIVISTRPAVGVTVDEKIIILTNGQMELNNIISVLNQETEYGVSVVYSRKAIELFGFWI